ncbi:MAG: hypothetical protein RMJ84_03625, partial [Sandaracinaceae bacterium]|nr:hypothetical protein [Sandaracinaceae bacterium]
MNRLRFFIIQLTKQASAIRWVRIAALGLATAFGTGGIIASLLGPLPPPWAVALSRLVWVSVVFFAVTALIRRNPKREGQAVARLIAPQDLSFADRLCSAHAFEQAPLSGLSADFAQAHIARVESELLAKRAESFLPFWDNTKREILTGASVLALSAFLFWKVPRLQGGVHALFFDSFTRSPHHPKALVLKLHSVRVEPPAYLQKEARTLGESHSIEAERGSRVELIAEPLLPQVQRIEWRLTDGRRLSFHPKSHTHHTLRFIVDSDMAGCFWAIQDNKEEIENLLCFHVTSIEDKAPSVQLLSPEADLTVDPNQNLSIWAEAQDDHEIDRLEAVLRLPGGQELRKSTGADPNLQSTANLRWEIPLGDLDIEPGDILWVWA